MEQINKTQGDNDPASTSSTKNDQEILGRPFPNGLQFEEAVQKLREAVEKHPKPPTGVFY